MRSRRFLLAAVAGLMALIATCFPGIPAQALKPVPSPTVTWTGSGLSETAGAYTVNNPVDCDDPAPADENLVFVLASTKQFSATAAPKLYIGDADISGRLMTKSNGTKRGTSSYKYTYNNTTGDALDVAGLVGHVTADGFGSATPTLTVDSGCLMSETTPDPPPPPPLGQSVQVSAGAYHACAVLADATVRCWGYNGDGELGVGDRTTRLAPGNAVNLGTGHTAKAIAAGSGHTCALLNDDSVKCWGDNAYGQLGLGDSGSGTRRLAPAETPVALGEGRTAKAIAAGPRHTCALLNDDSVKCWGWNQYGQLGLGDNTNRNAPEATPVALGAGAKAISAGFFHTCALLVDSTVKCWGVNGYGQLGMGDNTARTAPAATPVALGAGAKAIASGHSHTCVVLDDNTVTCWGWNEWWQLGLGDKTDRNEPTPVLPGQTAKAISAGLLHTCAILTDDTIKCWGVNGRGQLGVGDNDNRTAPGPTVAFTSPRFARSISLGTDYTCAVLDNNDVTCWGWNADGQLGLGDDTNKDAPPATPIDFTSSS
jgi:alpha-tubulin suppressor-like RCC1 family protein